MLVKDLVEIVKERPELLELELSHASDSSSREYKVTHAYIDWRKRLCLSGGGVHSAAFEELWPTRRKRNG